MTPASATVANVFRGLPQPDDLMARAAKRSGPGPRRRNNTHIHLPPNFSAFESVEQATALAAEQGVDVVGVSNYYDYRVYADFADRVRSARIFPLFGTEIIALLEDIAAAGIRINDPGNPGKMYICGKGITRVDPLSPEAAVLMEDIRQRDSSRMAAMVEKLADVFRQAGFDAGLDEGAVKARVQRRHGCPADAVYLQERHAAQAFQEVLAERTDPAERVRVLTAAYGAPPRSDPDAAVAIQNEIRAQLMKAGKPAYVPETFVGFDHAYRLILALGGIPCYPIVADGAKPICPFEDPVEKLVGELRARSLHCVEFIPLRNQRDVLGHYARATRAAGFVVTAGTEHNTLDLVPIEPACMGGQPVPDDVADIFWEGACVVAAHEYLAAHGRTGFVDEAGCPNGAYPSAEARIAAFSKLGAEVIDAYLAE